MNKSLRLTSMLVFVITALLANGGRALAVTGFTTGITVQDLSTSSAANFVIAYARQSDGWVYSATRDQLNALQSRIYNPLADAPTNFDGSSVTISNQPIGTVVSVLGNGGNAAAAYTAPSIGSTNVQVPLLMKGNSGYNTWMRVQNMGNVASSVNVYYTDGTSNSFSSLQPGGAAVFDQSLEYHPVAIFGASVSGSQPLAVAVVEHDPTTMFAYSGFRRGTPFPFLPLINANNSGWITGVQIKNAGAYDTYVIVTYTPSTAGTACNEGQTIPAGQSKSFALYAFNPGGTGITTNCQFGATFIGSARVTYNTATNGSAVPLAAIVNQLNTVDKKGEAYNAFDDSDATGTLAMPLILDRAAQFSASSYFTGINVMNVGSNTASVSCTFYGSSVVLSQNLAYGQSLTAIQLNALGANYAGSARCTAGAGSRIVGVVNVLDSTPGVDHFMVYEAINTP